MKELLDQSHDKSSIYAVSKVDWKAVYKKVKGEKSAAAGLKSPKLAKLHVCENVNHVLENMFKI